MDTSILLEILRDQREELDTLRSQRFCKRKEEDMVKLESKKAQVVIGVRRSRKSTLCFNVLDKAHVKFAYVNFDDERLVRLTADDLNDILRLCSLNFLAHTPPQRRENLRNRALDCPL